MIKEPTVEEMRKILRSMNKLQRVQPDGVVKYYAQINSIAVTF